MVFHASFIVTNFDILKNAWSYRFHSKRMDTTVEYNYVMLFFEVLTFNLPFNLP